MSKKKDEVDIDDLLDGEDDELPVIPETLRGEPKDKEDKADDFELDPGLDKALSKFADDEEEKESENPEEDDDTEKPQEKSEKGKFPKTALIVGIIAVAVIIAAGLFAFWQIGHIGAGNYIMTFDGEKIDIEEYKFFLMLLMQSAPADEKEITEIKEEALDWLKEFFIFQKMAEERSISLSQEEREDIKSNIQPLMDYYGFPYETLNIPENRLIDLLDYIFPYFGYAHSKLLDWFIGEYNLNTNDEAVALAVKEYRAESRFVRYIMIETEDEIEETRNALKIGSTTDIETNPNDIYQIIQNLYDNHGLLLSEDHYKKVMELNALEFTEAIDLSINYGIFIRATSEETEEWLRASHESHDHGEEEFAKELEEFRLNDTLLKYIITNTKKSAEEAYNALKAGTMTDIEIIKKYSDYYDESQGIDKIPLSQFSLPEKYSENIKALQESECSEIIASGPFIMFIEASESETENYVRRIQAYQILLDEIEFMQNDIKMEPNTKVYDKLDIVKFYETLYPPEK